MKTYLIQLDIHVITHSVNCTVVANTAIINSIDILTFFGIEYHEKNSQDNFFCYYFVSQQEI